MNDERPKHKSLAEAQLAVMEEVGYVRKEKSDQLKYTFASETALIAKLRPAMIRHGIVMAPVAASFVEAERWTTQRGAQMSMLLGTRSFRFTHVDSKDSIEVQVFAEAADAGDKRASKSMTLAKKYALREFFLIETGDDPDEVAEQRQDAEAAKQTILERLTQTRELERDEAMEEITALGNRLKNEPLPEGVKATLRKTLTAEFKRRRDEAPEPATA